MSKLEQKVMNLAPQGLEETIINTHKIYTSTKFLQIKQIITHTSHTSDG
jgi:hypothetical protein